MRLMCRQDITADRFCTLSTMASQFATTQL